MEPRVSCIYLTYCMEYAWKSSSWIGIFQRATQLQEYYWPTIYRAGAAVVSTITSLWTVLWSSGVGRGKSEKARLDYQPLFGKMSPHSSSGRIKDRTQETAEIEPTKRPVDKHLGPEEEWTSSQSALRLCFLQDGGVFLRTSCFYGLFVWNQTRFEEINYRV